VTGHATIILLEHTFPTRLVTRQRGSWRHRRRTNQPARYLTSDIVTSVENTRFSTLLGLRRRSWMRYSRPQPGCERPAPWSARILFSTVGSRYPRTPCKRTSRMSVWPPLIRLPLRIRFVQGGVAGMTVANSRTYSPAHIWKLLSQRAVELIRAAVHGAPRRFSRTIRFQLPVHCVNRMPHFSDSDRR
jgi:hypothetical protein